jgi:hypothetical protein
MAIISLNGINQLIFVMVKYGVLCEVRTDNLSIIKTSIGFKELVKWQRSGDAGLEYRPSYLLTLFCTVSQGECLTSFFL